MPRLNTLIVQSTTRSSVGGSAAVTVARILPYERGQHGTDVVEVDRRLLQDPHVIELSARVDVNAAAYLVVTRVVGRFGEAIGNDRASESIAYGGAGPRKASIREVQ